MYVCIYVCISCQFGKSSAFNGFEKSYAKKLVPTFLQKAQTTWMLTNFAKNSSSSADLEGALLEKKQMVILLITWACMVFFWHQGTKDHVGLTSIASNPELIELRVRAWKWMVGIQVSSWDGLIFSGVICMLVLGSVISKYQVLCIPTIYHFGNVGLLFRKCIFPARGRSDENPLTWSHLDLGSDTMTTRRITLLLCLDNEYLGRKICPKVWSSNTADASEKPTLTT